MGKRVICIIIAFMMVISFSNIKLDAASDKYYIGGDSDYCLGCGCDILVLDANKLFEEENIYYVRGGQLEAEYAIGRIEMKYGFGTDHIDPATGKKCTNNTNIGNYCIRDDIVGYFKSKAFPVINMSSTSNIDLSNSLNTALLCTSNAVTPSFSVTFEGKKIAKSNYDYYITKGVDKSLRYYSYASTATKSVSEPGLYYLNVMFDPNNTCGPNGSTFLGRLEFPFEVVKEKKVSLSVDLSQSTFEYDGTIQKPGVLFVEAFSSDWSSSIPIPSENIIVNYSNNKSSENGTYDVYVSIKPYYYDYDGDGLGEVLTGSTTLSYVITDGTYQGNSGNTYGTAVSLRNGNTVYKTNDAYNFVVYKDQNGNIIKNTTLIYSDGTFEVLNDNGYAYINGNTTYGDPVLLNEYGHVIFKSTDTNGKEVYKDNSGNIVTGKVTLSDGTILELDNNGNIINNSENGNSNSNSSTSNQSSNSSATADKNGSEGADGTNKASKEENGTDISNGANSSEKGGNSASNSNYSNEWVNGKWYNADGTQTYEGILEWKCNSTGWWVEDTSGWYPYSCWQKIDGKWYYFCNDGYMDYSEYRDGCWLRSDGSWDESFSGGSWKYDGYGWYYEDNGWYPANQYLWVDGTRYWFNSSGYYE